MQKSNPMKYIVRAVKYFLYITVIFTIVLWILACLTSHRFIFNVSEIVGTLVHGWGSVGLILGVFAAVAAIYPMLGYGKIQVAVGGSIAELKPYIDEYMLNRGYIFEKQTVDSISYRLVSGAGRMTRTWEDRVTLTQNAGGLVAEGLRKDVARIVSGLETRLGSKEE